MPIADKALLAAFRANHHPDAEPSSVELDKLAKSIRAYTTALTGDAPELIRRLTAATMRTDWGDLPDDAAIPAIPLIKEAATLITAQAERIAELERGLDAAARTMRNSRGAIESNQIEDKEVRRQLTNGIDAARSLLNKDATHDR